MSRRSQKKDDKKKLASMDTETGTSERTELDNAEPATPTGTSIEDTENELEFMEQMTKAETDLFRKRRG